jgi:O-antigen/teichoic acid export membrane protein
MNKFDSFVKRYFIKFLKSVSDFLINIFLLTFIPRILGPSNYGSFNYIRDTFQNIFTFADLNLNSAHINYTARKNNSETASNVYFTYTLIVGILTLLFTFFITQFGFDKYIFPGQTKNYLFFGFILGYFMYLSNALIGLSDSKIATFGFEIRSIVINILMFCVLIIIYLTHLISIETFFLQRILLYFLLVIFGYFYLSGSINYKFRIANPSNKKVKAIIIDYFTFSYPLFTLSIVGLLFNFFDRWFLQIIYGSVSMGFFSLAFSLSTIASLFLAPMIPLIMQSIAKADEENNLLEVKKAFDKIKYLYLIGAFLSIFFIFHTNKIIELIGGNEYKAASTSVIIMFIYTIHIVYGQVCGGILIALRKTKLYRNISFFSTIFGVIFSYFLLAPKSFLLPGLELGSFGLAIKFVLVQLVSILVQLHFVCKLLKIKIREYLISQIIIPIPILFVGFTETFLLRYLSFNVSGPIENILFMGLSLFFWVFILGIILLIFPKLIGFNKQGLISNIFQAVNFLHKKNLD